MAWNCTQTIHKSEEKRPVGSFQECARASDQRDVSRGRRRAHVQAGLADGAAAVQGPSERPDSSVKSMFSGQVFIKVTGIV